ncbi:MAG: hypothetical protein GY856_17655, partial [bacterium]|nr:hypothetical protein [bacterium]
MLEDLQLDPKLTLSEYLRRAPALSLDYLEERWMDLKVQDLDITLHDATPGIAVYRPPGIELRAMAEDRPDDQEPPPKPTAEDSAAQDSAAEGGATETDASVEDAESSGDPTPSSPRHAESLEEREVVELAYHDEIQGAAGFLRAGLS